MGILRAVSNFINANSADEYYNGVEWAETLEEVDAEVSPMQVERMAEDLSSNPTAFYEGFRDMWNSGPNVEKEPSLWDKLCGRG